MVEGVRKLKVGTVVHYCPVDDCDWTSRPRTVDATVTLDLASATRSLPLLPGSLLDEAVRRQLLREADEVEAELREHLGSHDVVDFLRTIRRLRDDLEAT